MENENILQPNYEEELVRVIKSSSADDEIREQLDNYHENDIAGTLELLSVEERKKLYRILGAEKVSEIFTYLDDVGKYIGELALESAADIIENMDSDDAVDVLEEVDDTVREQLISLMDEDSKRDIDLIRSYDDDEIGSKMTTNFIEIKKNLSVKQAMKELISQAEENDNIMTIYVCDEKGKFYGALELKDLIVARDYTNLEPLISTSYPYVRDHETISECIDRIKDYAEDSIPILSDSHEILGVITAQDIVEVVDDEMGDDYAKLAGLTAEEDLHETLPESMKKRMPWLIALLFLGMGVSSVVGMFETVVSQVALIVCFQSLILDMAGNVGTQSLAVTIRVLMDENLKAKQKIQLVLKEMRVGFSNGILLGALSFLFIGLYIYFLKGKTMLYAFAISGCVGIALMAAMVISSFVGTIVPMFFHKIKIDPAVASGPLITTVNDLVAVVTYYGLAWVLLINVLKLV
ncbi:MAG: magnesium transporter [Clostridia bacterium]|nr:magnesium transporter [Clostridia bacterium]NCC42129.1 magnesium transporter [Clostridia bacterium]